MLANWVKESVDSAPGTGTIDLGGAETGYIAFGDIYRDGEVVNYTVEDGNNRESGIGTFTDAATDTLSRDTVLETLLSGTYDNTSPTAITLTANAVVSVSANASSIMSAPVAQNIGTYGVVSAHIAEETASLSQSTMDANKTYAHPFLLLNSMEVSKIGLGMSATAGTKFRLGIYAVGSDGLPGALLATTGDQTPSIADIDASLTANIYLNPGWYYVGIVQDGASTIDMVNRAEGFITTPAGLATADYKTVMLEIASASWSALPDPYGSGSAVYTKNIPWLRLL